MLIFILGKVFAIHATLIIIFARLMKLKSFISCLLLLVSCFLATAQEQIDYKADKIKFLKTYKGGAKRLIGNVQFTTKEGMHMTCDSSYFLDNNNIEAYSNIFIRQGDSLTITGNTAHYDGTTKLGIIDGKVTCTEKDMVLTTDVLHFDSRNRTSSYYTGGTIVSKENTLTSKHGFYDSPSKTVSFKYDVKLVNPDYTMLADTLRYITTSKTVIFLGPTNIVSKKDKLYCERGWYNTQTQISHLTKNAIIYSGKSIMKADSIHYEKKKETGFGYSNVNLIDTAEKTIISGNRSYSNKKSGIMWMTDHCLLTKVMGKDSLFATADSMWAFEKKIKIKRDTSIETRDVRRDTANKSTQDSSLKSPTDTASNLKSPKDTSKFREMDSTVIKAYRHVKI
jgi:lipopolysaccharide assembly outer membrane protein LptD (OstA)